MTEAVTVPTTQFYTWALPLRLRTLCPNSSFQRRHSSAVDSSHWCWVIPHFGIGSAANGMRQIALIRFTIQTYWAVVRVTCRMAYTPTDWMSSCNTFGDGGVQSL